MRAVGILLFDPDAEDTDITEETNALYRL